MKSMIRKWKVRRGNVSINWGERLFWWDSNRDRDKALQAKCKLYEMEDINSWIEYIKNKQVDPKKG